jgi:hypothetical protein
LQDNTNSYQKQILIINLDIFLKHDNNTLSSKWYLQINFYKALYILLSKWVLRNTDLDEKPEYIQVTLRKYNKKYKNSEYDDNIVESLMKYLELESYEQLEDYLEHDHIPKFD